MLRHQYSSTSRIALMRYTQSVGLDTDHSHNVQPHSDLRLYIEDQAGNSYHHHRA